MRYVLTGPSSSGKSTLLAALAARGVATVPEAGRPLVRAALAGQGGALPWAAPVRFRDLAFWASVRAFDVHETTQGSVLFDRSFVEAAAHTQHAPLSRDMEAALQARRFADPVFVCPPWREIYAQDAERPKPWAVAQAEWVQERQAYLDQGYTLKEVPHADLPARVAWMLRALTA